MVPQSFSTPKFLLLSMIHHNFFIINDKPLTFLNVYRPKIVELFSNFFLFNLIDFRRKN